MTTLPKVAIIVLNWNNAPDTIECLESLRHLNYSAYRISVVDNGSTDDSVHQIRSRFPDVCLTETHQNLGYAGGNNVAIRETLAQGAEMICILNNDVRVDPNFLTSLVTALQEHTDVGLVSPLVAELDDPDKIWALGQSVNGQTGAVARIHQGVDVSALVLREPFQVDAASGTAMLIRREIFERIGFMDEAYFLYYEETDWSIRIRQAGYRILAVPTSMVWHAVSGTLGQSSPVVDYYMLRNHLLLVQRYWTGLARARILASIVVEELRVMLAYTIKSWNGKRLPNRNARALALRDALIGRFGKMGADVARVCASR
jgi:GT2 family glycosyltransferase